MFIKSWKQLVYTLHYYKCSKRSKSERHRLFAANQSAICRNCWISKEKNKYNIPNNFIILEPYLCCVIMLFTFTDTNSNIFIIYFDVHLLVKGFKLHATTFWAPKKKYKTPSTEKTFNAKTINSISFLHCSYIIHVYSKYLKTKFLNLSKNLIYIL